MKKCSNTLLALLVLHGALGIYYIAILYTNFDWDSGITSLLSPSLST